MCVLHTVLDIVAARLFFQVPPTQVWIISKDDSVYPPWNNWSFLFLYIMELWYSMLQFLLCFKFTWQTTIICFQIRISKTILSKSLRQTWILGAIIWILMRQHWKEHTRRTTTNTMNIQIKHFFPCLEPFQLRGHGKAGCEEGDLQGWRLNRVTK